VGRIFEKKLLTQKSALSGIEFQLIEKNGGERLKLHYKTALISWLDFGYTTFSCLAHHFNEETYELVPVQKAFVPPVFLPRHFREKSETREETLSYEPHISQLEQGSWLEAMVKVRQVTTLILLNRPFSLWTLMVICWKAYLWIQFLFVSFEYLLDAVA